MRAFQPIILAGGIGARLWPISRASHPKHLLPLLSRNSLIAVCARRLSGHRGALPAIIMTASEHAVTTREILNDANIPFDMIVAEPEARSTGFAAAVGSLQVAEQNEKLPILLSPCDSYFSDIATFHIALDQALAIATRDKLVLFGAKPDYPSTQHGYIAPGTPLSESVNRVAAFYEKPALAKARELFAQGCLWNTGHFLAFAETILNELACYAPSVLEAAKGAYRRARKNGNILVLDRTTAVDCQTVSFDYAVMENTKRAIVVSLNDHWMDIGNFDALWRLGQKNDSGNVVIQNALIRDINGLFVKAGSDVTAAAKFDDLLVVVEGEFVLVRQSNNDGELIAAKSKLTDREGERRPWGSFTILARGDGFQVKLLEVDAGQSLSLQYHKSRAEHWVITKGEPRITIGAQSGNYRVNEHVFVPLGTEHRLENPTETGVAIIEVQIGTYLGEDDIVRLQDRYNRA